MGVVDAVQIIDSIMVRSLPTADVKPVSCTKLTTVLQRSFSSVGPSQRYFSTTHSRTTRGQTSAASPTAFGARARSRSAAQSALNHAASDGHPYARSSGPFGNLKLRKLQLPRSGSDGQPIESSHLVRKFSTDRKTIRYPDHRKPEGDKEPKGRAMQKKVR